MNKYDLEYIDKLRIHELRDFARKLGVSSPTTKKKKELIGKITSIVKDSKDFKTSDKKYVNNDCEMDFFSLLTSDNSNILADLLANKDEKETQKSNKNLEVISTPENKTNTMIVRKTYSDDTPYPSFEDVVNLSFCVNQNEAPYGDSDIYDVYGFVDIHPSGYGILRYNGFVPSENDSYLATSLVKQHNLKKGQYICGKAKYIMLNKPKVVYEITNIDGSTNNKSLKNFEDLEYNGIGEEYYLDKFNFSMRKGERHYIENMSIKDAVDLGFDLVDENSTSVKLINIKARPEDNYKSHQKMQIIHIPFNTSEIEVVNSVELVAERIKREFEQGKQNVLIIYNFSELVRVFNVACEGCVDYDKINSKAVNKIYNILYLSKFLDENTSCSVICIDRNGVPRDLTSLMELDLTPLFNKCHKSIERK